MKIFIAMTLEQEQLSRLRDRLDVQICYHPALDDAGRAAIRDCEVAFGNPPAEWLVDTPSLRWVQLESVGFGEYASLDWKSLGKRLRASNLKGFFDEPVAQSILAGILAHYRGMTRLAQLQAKEEWEGDALRPRLRTLGGDSVMLFGYGDINRRVEALLSPYHCSITRFRSDWAMPALEKALEAADIVICVAPHTAATRGLFDRELLAKLKRGALFVNFGRGSLVDEEALADALESGALGGAAIDVTQDEPLPASHRFWHCRNMLLTQHTGGGTGDEIDRKIDVFLANLGRYRRGEAPLGLVDFQREY